MKSLMSLLHVLLQDCGSMACTNTERDWKTISSRVEHEGLSFITIVLPGFRSHFERSLDQKRWIPDLLGFSKSAGLPRFLGGFLNQVFDSSSLALLDEPNITAIRCIRQITGFASKIELETTASRNKAAIDGFIKCEIDVASWEDNVLPSMDLSDFDRMVSLLLAPTLSKIDREIYLGNVVPKHGPGATADRRKANQKYALTSWPQRLDEMFPVLEYLYPNSGWYQEAQLVDIYEPGMELPVKITLVPKTMKTPRIIAVEPTAMQYVQQGILELIVNYVEEDPILRKMVSWQSQIPNQEMARQGSIDGLLATLDLSEASDRVSNALVNRMLKNFPHLSEACQRTRSTRAKLPDGKLIELRKFASMGSALCFPIESMVFITLSLLGVARAQGVRPSRHWLKSMTGKVRTFGDDIVVPSSSAQLVSLTLSDFGLKVNTTKSFWTGEFRESCGKEYFRGSDVSITKIRRNIPRSKRDLDELVSSVSTRNQLYELGYWEAADYLTRVIERIIPFPANGANSSGLTAMTYGPIRAEGHSSHLHSGFVKAAVVKYETPSNAVEEHGALMKFFLKRGISPHKDVTHLLRSGRPKAVGLKIKHIPVVFD